jgi:hypothetical protein
MSREADIKKILDTWNFYRGRGNWHACNKVTADVKSACTSRLREFGVDIVCEAINNYAMILLDKKYVWSYAWSLAMFLTRHRPDDRGILQMTRFIGSNGNFVAYDYLTPQAKRDIATTRETKKAEIKHQQDQKEIERYKSMPSMTLEQKIKLYESGRQNLFTKQMLKKLYAERETKGD